MRYEYVSNDSRHYATALRINRSTGDLIWDSAQGQDVLIVQTPFGQSPLELMESSICPAMSAVELSHDRFTEILPDIWVRPLTALERARNNNGCPLHMRACTYTVFAATRVDKSDVVVYAPKTNTMISPACDVPLELRVSVSRQVTLEGLFRKREVDTGYWQISFTGSLEGLSEDVDLFYTLGPGGRLAIPLTERAVSQGAVYVRSVMRPHVKSGNPGLRIVEE